MGVLELLHGQIEKSEAEVEKLRSAIRKHRDQRGDDRCWLDDEELYRVLPEGYTPPERDTEVELGRCVQFIRCRHNPATEYVSPQTRIDELEAELERLGAAIQDLVAAWTETGWPSPRLKRAIDELQRAPRL